MFIVLQAKTDLEKSVEAQRRMEAELEEHKKTRKMLESKTSWSLYQDTVYWHA